MTVEIPVAAFAFVFVMVAFGALIQGSIGFGLGFAAAPTMTLIRPEAVPATLLILTIPMMVIIALRERSSINFRGFLLITGSPRPNLREPTFNDRSRRPRQISRATAWPRTKGG
jgi:hypothetical protein